MSRSKPVFFTEVQSKARKRWEQLEGDPELGAPWRQLFQQVQSPRHVLSELLQNADDAGAKSAYARVEDSVFYFSHDGSDFDRDQFASLCRFGFSNKRNLHTIGFRGIGFKSTFSLGDSVEVFTPSLAFRFGNKRFTEPTWIDDAKPCTKTTVAVRLRDAHCLRELRKNLRDWAQSPASLLFFRHIERLQMEDDVIEKRITGEGPFSEAKYVAIGHQPPVLVIHSEELAFPEDSVREIKAERFADDDSRGLPPCRVEIVIGLPGNQRLFVVLPTGVTVDLPFSCNAPFLQDPGRFSIKDPANSPTNRWLLERLGKLAGASLKIWLNRPDLNLSARAKAYELVPSSPCDAGSLESSCHDEVSRAFGAKVEDAPVVLTETGRLVKAGHCVAPPTELYSVWPSDVIAKLFGHAGKALLAEAVSPKARSSLTDWNLIDEVEETAVIRRLQTEPPPPRPTSLAALAHLWAFVEDNSKYDYANHARKKALIVPVEGSDTLLAAEDAVRKPMTRVLASSDAWNLVFKNVSVLDQEWVDLLECDDVADELADDYRERRNTAANLLHALGLSTPTSWDKILTHVSEALRGKKETSVEDYVELAHIMAAVNVEATKEFSYITRDKCTRTRDECLIYDPSGDVESIVTKEWADEHLLHDRYNTQFDSCTREQWKQWCASQKSGLRAGVPLIVVVPTPAWNSKYRLREFLARRGADEPTTYPYRLENFKAEDFDFPLALVRKWNEEAASVPSVWYTVFRQLASDPQQPWARQAKCTIHQNASSRNKVLDCDVMAAWLHRFRGLACLKDTYGKLREPVELLMRTPDTEPLMGVELFVRAEDDTEATKPLLRLLGVRDTPSSPEKLLDRLRVLATMQTVPVHEVAKWYDAIDRILARCRPVDLESTKQAFQAERLVFTETCDWVRLGEVFLETDDHDIPDAPLVHSAARSLSMWPRLGVAKRPTADIVLNWLKTLPTGGQLEGSELRRIQSLLKRFPIQVWADCGHWLSLDGTWEETGALNYFVSMQHLARSAEIFSFFKARTADLRRLTNEFLGHPPFDSLIGLGAVIEYRLTRLQDDLPLAIAKPWLRALGEALSRVITGDAQMTEQTRGVAARLAKTVWQSFRHLQVTPYIENTPAGHDHSPDVLWHQETLFVHEGPVSKRFNAIVTELARPFEWTEVPNIIRACAERDAAFVMEYFESNYELEQPTLFEPALEHTAAEETAVSAGESPPSDAGIGRLPADAPGEGIPAAESAAVNGELGGDRIERDDPPHPIPVEPKPMRRPELPALIHRFAVSLGYQWEPFRKRFVHENGSWIQSVHGQVFNWEQHSIAGDVETRYWVSSQTLSNGGIEVPAELWELTKRAPEVSAWILEDTERRPEKLFGTDLLRRVDHEKTLKLYPAKYRIREADI